MTQILNGKNSSLVIANVLKLSTVLLLLLTTAACSGKKIFDKEPVSADKQETVQSTEDITRPPEVDKSARQEQAPTKGETISYEEWKQEQGSAKSDE